MSHAINEYNELKLVYPKVENKKSPHLAIWGFEFVSILTIQNLHQRLSLRIHLLK